MKKTKTNFSLYLHQHKPCTRTRAQNTRFASKMGSHVSYLCPSCFDRKLVHYCFSSSELGVY